jgi:hypothetical protein
MYRPVHRQAHLLRDHVARWLQLWQAADKVVYSHTLKSVSSTRTRIEREFDSRRSGADEGGGGA